MRIRIASKHCTAQMVQRGCKEYGIDSILFYLFCVRSVVVKRKNKYYYFIGSILKKSINNFNKQRNLSSETLDQSNCFSCQVIQRQDQLVPYYIMDVAATVPCLPGLFVAGVFSAALRYCFS
jgi:hypothetical protein